MGYMQNNCYNGQVNLKKNLDNTSAIYVEERCSTRGVDPEYFLSRLLESFAVTVNGQQLTVTMTMADGSIKTQTVTLP